MFNFFKKNFQENLVFPLFLYIFALLVVEKVVYYGFRKTLKSKEKGVEG